MYQVKHGIKLVCMDTHANVIELSWKFNQLLIVTFPHGL